MKRYSLIVALHIIGIAFLSVGVYLLVDAGLWFSALMAFLILLAIAVHLYRLQMMQVRMMRHLAESLRYDDMMLSFRSPYKNRSMEDMVDELSEAMRNFRTRVLERNEMEAWQKLIRVLTHEIMNSITPIISLSETLSEREMYNPQIQISAESETKRSIFREKDKTKRSKKESAQHSKSRNKSFVMTSVSAL